MSSKGNKLKCEMISKAKNEMTMKNYSNIIQELFMLNVNHS